MSFVSTVLDLDRLRQISQVLIRHGFGALAAKMGLPGTKKAAPSPEGQSSDLHDLGVRLRLALQDLGTTFVKLGQIVSTRPDLIPPEIVTELKRLQDDVAPFDSALARQQISEELGGAVDQLFRQIDEEPLACASVAQVYRAIVAGEEGDEQVAIKVQRPGIAQTVARDLNLLHHLARLLERTIPEAQVYSPSGLVSEFERAILAELDFTVEAANAESFAANFATEADLRFPKIYRRLSSRRVLTMEYLAGLKVDEAVRRGADGAWIATTAVRVLLRMVFEDGFFHADPHPGNFVIMPVPPEGKRYQEGAALQIGLLDLGLVGRLSPALRDRTADLLLAAARNDSAALADAMLAVGRARAPVDRAAFRAYVDRVSAKHLGKPLQEVEAAAVLGDLVAGALAFQIEIPTELTMLFRAIVTVEGVGKEIHPELDVLQVAKPYLIKMLWARYHPTRLAKDGLRELSLLKELARDLPAQLSSIANALDQGRLQIRTEDRAGARSRERLGRRIRAGLVVLGAAGCGTALSLGGQGLLGQRLLLGAGVYLLAHLLFDWLHLRDDRERKGR